MKKFLISSLIYFSVFLFSCKSAQIAPVNEVIQETQEPILIEPASEYDWKEEYAYHIGVQAYIYAYPAIYYSHLRYGMIENPQGLVSMPINTYNHVRTLSQPEHQYGGSPNRDTPYSLAFVDLTDDAVVLTAPDNTDNRYFAIQMVDFYSDVFAYIGKRLNGLKGGNYLVLGPNYKDEIPDGFDGVYHCPSNWMWIVSRTYTEGTEDDLSIVHQFQDAHDITMLKDWGKDTKVKYESRDVLDPAPMTDPLGAFKTMNAVMKENPPPKKDEILMQQFAQIGLGPYGVDDIDSLDPSIKKGLGRALMASHKILAEVAKVGGSITGQSKMVNNWFYSPKNWGRMAETGDFLGRASPQAFSGIVEHHVEEASKMRTFKDENGELLNAAHKYVLHFEKNQIPQPKEFWSLTMYDERFNLVSNPDRIFSVGSMFTEMKYNADGSLTLLIQRDKPSEDMIHNWLPTPESGDFNLFLRSYMPEDAFINHELIAPPVRKVK